MRSFEPSKRKTFILQLLFGIFLAALFASFIRDSKKLDFYSLIISRFNKIWIGAPQEKVYLQTDKPYYVAGESIWFKGYLVNATTHQPTTLSRYIYVELINQNDSLVCRAKIRRDSLGFNGSLPLKQDLPEGYYTLRGFTYWMQNATSDFFFHKKIFVGNSQTEKVKAGLPANSAKNLKNRKQPALPAEFDLQFFPESGTLLTDQLQIIAFKAIASDGLSVEVSGRIYTDQQEELFSFETSGRGMGSLVLQPKAGNKYYALVKTAAGQEKRFELPEQQAEGIALHLGCYNGNILYEAINKTGKANQSLYLLVHARGKVFVFSRLTSLNGRIPETALPAGINSFAIVDTLGNIFCERLLFDWSLNLPSIEMQTKEVTYGRRELVELNLNLHSVTGKSPAGNFAVSITDSKVVVRDTLADNMLSYLLLSSDIKGYIEQPARYFMGDPAMERARMDLLMLTQGWRRFNTADIVKGNYPRQKYFLEMGQSLTGRVASIFGKPIKKCDVILLSEYKNTTRIVQTDTLGRYIFDGIDFPDSTSIILKANKNRGIMDVELIPDEDFFLKSEGVVPLPAKVETKRLVDYLQQSREHFSYEGGMHVDLAEITVEAKKKEENGHNFYYSGLGDDNINREELEKYSGMSIKSALSMLSGVQVMGDEISIRGAGTPLFVVENFNTNNFDEISYLSTYDIEKIELFKGASAAIFGSRGGNGVIAITLRSGASMDRLDRVPLSLAQILPLGYQQPRQFYTPKYEVDSIRRSPIPDLRTTIYWNPNLQPDSTGTIHARFFTADKANDYSVVLEGITNNGEICRFIGVLKREDR